MRKCQFPRPTAQQIFFSATIVLPLLTLISYTPSGHGLWIDTAYNFTHVPIFCAVAIGIFMLTRYRFQLSARITLTCIAVFTLSVLSEAAQYPTSRNASFGDLGRDIVGGMVGLIICLVFSRDSILGRSTEVFLLLAAGLLLAPTLVPLSNVSLAYLERKQQLPLLIDGSQHHVLRFIRGQDARTAGVVSGSTGRNCIHTRAEGGSGPGLAFENLWPDWSAYEGINIDLDNPGGAPLEIVVRVHDLQHLEGVQPHSDRYNSTFILDAGPNVLEISMIDIKTAPIGRIMNVGRINGLGIFSNSVREDAGFCVYQIELLRAAN